MKSQLNSDHVYRLRQLIEFLWQLPRERFDFSKVRHACGTVACGFGWTPALFPDLVRVVNLGSYQLVESIATHSVCMISVSKELFGLSGDEMEYCFVPSTASEQTSCPLPKTCSPQQLAAHLESFLAGKIAAGEAEDPLSRTLPVGHARSAEDNATGCIPPSVERAQPVTAQL